MNKKTLRLSIAILIALVGVGSVYALNRHNTSAKNHDAMMAHDTAMKQSDNAKMQLAIATTPSGTPTNAMMHEDAMMAMHGTYLTLSEYTNMKANFSGDKKVLFFHASWCPICQSIDKEITDNPASLPAKTVIIKADYDAQTALKQAYGITQQYSFVEFDNNGNQIKKWSASTLADVLSQIQ
jgi:thioredoxin 1